MKLWENGLHGELNKFADDFNSSISVDGRMYKQDITGSIAHAEMLARQNIITVDESVTIVTALKQILADIDDGKLSIDPAAEDIHSFVEGELVSRVGDVGKKLHTARSRNDQVAVDVRMYLREKATNVIDLLKELIEVISKQALKYKDTVMPGYTHLQRAQPITFGHHLMAYGFMFLRDIERVEDAVKRINISPLGSCALAGTSFPLDRVSCAKALGFTDACRNSIDGVSDRDFCVELAADLSLIMTHLSRFCEEIIMWSSWE
ncbi:MAG: argininosuccinate lyase, partial [Clostridia bacterium]|nr:argininosuccinate lyase [Clostridia bacterium]